MQTRLAFLSALLARNEKTGRMVTVMYNPQLETFLCVVESGSFNKAAEKLYISPPAVIKQINLLEENLDLQLFIRTHRGLVLTKAGNPCTRMRNISFNIVRTL